LPESNPDARRLQLHTGNPAGRETSFTLSELETPVPPEPVQISRTVRNVLSNWFGWLIVSVINFLLAPFVVSRLGNTGYGIWVLIGSLTGYMGLLDLGVRATVTRYVAKFYAVADHQQLNRIVASALLVFICSGILAIAIAIVLSWFVLDLFHIPVTHLATARVVLILAGCSIAASLLGGVFGGILVGLQRFDLHNLVDILAAMLRAVAIILALRAGQGLVAMACIQFGMTALTWVAYAWLSYRIYRPLEIRFSESDWSTVRLVFSFGIYSVILDASKYLIFSTDSVVIASFHPVGLITFFAIASNLTAYTRSLVAGLSTTMLPTASALDAIGKKAELQEIVLRNARFATLLVFPIGWTFALRGRSLIELWMGKEYGELAGLVLLILTLALVFFASDQVGISTMRGIGRHQPLVPVILGEGIANLALSILLVRPMGVIGVAWGTTIPSLAVSLLFWPWYIRRTLGISIRRYVASTWVQPALATIPFALATYAVERQWLAGNIAVFVVQVGILLPVAAAGAWYVALAPTDRKQFIEKVVRPMTRILPLC